jgi:signal transduction histidine kinase
VALSETDVPPVVRRRLRLPARPPRVDVALAAAFVVMTLAEAAFSPDVASPVEHAVFGSLAMALLAWRRSAPLAVAALVVAVNIATNPAGEFSTLLSLVLVCFTIGSETAPPRSYVGLLLVLVPFVAVSIAHDLEPSDLAAALVFFVGPWTVGGVVQSRVARTEEAVARAERLERDRELEAARAAAEERTRIARELHDIVSHSISVVTIQTQAVRRRLGPEHAAEAADLAAVEATAREALAEMRRLFGVLRTEGEEVSLAPQPGLSELGRLVEKVGAGDMRVCLTLEGDPVDLPAGVDLAAYRIAQEGLTNAVRHSGATRADVRLRYAPGRLDIEVEDDGRGLRDPGPGGHGLVGIRERVALYDGTVHLTASPSGGVLLAAHLPLPEAP